MPNLQDELLDLHGSEGFETLDFYQGHWQIPLHKYSQDCLVLAGLFSHQWERVATPTICTRPRENTASRDATPVELMMKHERSRPKGVAGKVDVLDELQIISCKRLKTVRRYGWL
jgi:hypothetical protein